MKKRLIWWGLIFLWCALIFYGSSNNGNDSGKQSAFILELLSGLFGGKFPVSEYFIRKCAHFSEYFVLGCLLLKGFSSDKLYKTLLFSSLAGVAYAASDEIHQYFTPGRAPRLFDIFIDSLGLLTGVIILSLFIYVKRRKKQETRDNSGKV